MNRKQTEIWMPIQGYVGYYEVSNAGRVRSVSRIIENRGSGKGYGTRKLSGKIRKAFPGGKGGYLYVRLHRDGASRPFTVHGLVFRAFVSNPDKLPEINHRDGNKLNNQSFNLSPSTRRENVLHAIRLGLQSSMEGSQNIMAKLSDKSVRVIRKKFELGESQSSIASSFGITFQNVHCIVRRKSWKFLD